MLAPEQTVSEIALPALDVRAFARRAAVPALVAAAAVALAVLAGGQVHAFADAVQRVQGVSPAWLTVGIVFECVSLVGYVALLSLVAGRVTPRVGARESAQITLAGAAATRLLPTAGAGGAALTVWALRRAGLGALAAGRTLLAFFVVLYAVFLGSIALAGGALALGLVHAHGPLALSALPAADRRDAERDQDPSHPAAQVGQRDHRERGRRAEGVEHRPQDRRVERPARRRSALVSPPWPGAWPARPSSTWTAPAGRRRRTRWLRPSPVT
jgi:hypothetical protein